MNTTAKPAKYADLKKLARKMGASIERYDYREITCNIDAPVGKVWACEHLHTLVCYWNKHEEGYEHEAITDAMERMSAGLADCTDPECEHCHDEC